MKQITSKETYNLLKKVFKGKEKKGWCWVNEKFKKTDFEKMHPMEIEIIYNCLLSKIENTKCDFHNKIHDGRK